MLNLKNINIAVFAIAVLSLGMGIGRFIYTPILPVMLREGIFTLDELSYIASSNYAGYLFGSLFFSFGKLGNTSRTSFMLYGSALATSLLILAMGFIDNFFLAMFVRFFAGIASAGMMIFGSVMVLYYTSNVKIVASLYAGVGVGILLGNEYVVSGLNYNFDARNLWLGGSSISAVLLLMLFILVPHDIKQSKSDISACPENNDIVWWQLALLYGLAGFGYIIIATYLPFMTETLDDPVLTDHLWSLVGLGIIPSCYIWLWAGNRWGIVRCLTINLIIQAICVLLILSHESVTLLLVSCIGFGATFMGTTSLVMPLAKRLYVPANINLLGLVTLTYGIGQILGPLLTTILLKAHPGTIAPAVICGALALFLAAGICQFCRLKE